MKITVAVVQMICAPGAPDDNRRRALAFASDAADAGAQIVVLPELCISGYTLRNDQLQAAAEPLDGPTLSAFRSLARDKNVLITVGFCERDGSALYNSAMLIGAEGVLLHYQKLHLFDQEKLVFAAGGRGLPVAVTPFGCIGLCVCYDLRFMEVLRGLSLQGAEMALVPTAWVAGFDPKPRDAMGLIGQARGAALQANLNQIVVACAGQGGRTADHAFLGSSMMADPFGNIVVGPLDDAEERIITSVFDLDQVRAAQRRSDLVRPREDRRVDVYGLKIGDRIF